MLKRICFLIYVICLGLTGFAQATDEVRPLEPGRLMEREIASGQTHTYRITLAAGQFMQVGVLPRGVNVLLTLLAPDSKQVANVNFASFGGPETLSWEAVAAGDYQLKVAASGDVTSNGAYQARLEVRAAAAQDRRQIAIERLLAEVDQLSGQGVAVAPQTLERAQQALALCRESADQPGEAFALVQVGGAWRSQDNNEKAAESYEQSLALFRKLKSYRGDEGRLLSLLGNAYIMLGQQEKAIERLEQALQVRRDLKDRVGEGATLRALATAFNRLSREEKAIEYGELALRVARETKDRNVEADSLNSLGSSAYFLGDYERAGEYFEQALAISRELKDRKSEGGYLLNLGNVYNLLNRLEKSLDYFEQSLAIAREAKSRQVEALALTCLGNGSKSLKDYDKALSYLDQSLTIYRELKDRFTESLTLASLGDTYREMGHADKAIEILDQSLAIKREIKDRRGEAIALNMLGSAHISLKRYDRAIDSLEQAVAISREVRDRLNESVFLNNLGDAWLGRDYFDKAAEYFQQSLAIRRELKDQVGKTYVLSGLAHTELKRGNPGQARTFIEETLKIFESLRSDILNPDLRASFFATAQDSYRFYIDLLMPLNGDAPGKGYDALAIEASERARARSLLELLAEGGAGMRQGVDVSLLERERTLARRLNARAQQLTDSNNTAEQAAALKQEISALEKDQQQAQAAIRRASPRYNALTSPQPLKLAEMQQQLDEETILLEFSLGEERSFLWAVTKNSLSSFELPKREQIEQGARRVYGLLTARSRSLKGETPSQRRARLTEADRQFPSAAQQLSQVLLSPVAAELGNKRLVVVADGALQYLPFAMLPEPTTGRQGERATGRGISDRPVSGSPGRPAAFTPLIVNHEVINLPSASTIAVQRRELAGRPTAPKTLAVVADPVFTASDERLKSVTIGVTAQPVEPREETQAANAGNTRIIEHLAESSTVGPAHKLAIPRLHFTRREADQIMGIASGAPGEWNLKAVDFKANRAIFSGPELSQYRYIHIATHGLFDSERPGLSALVLSLVDEQGKPQDGFLRAHEIYNLNLPADLVVLSACQTGLGKEIKGEGLVGMTRGFMYAGAARVVVSLWNVNDKATSELMAKFYKNMFKDGERPAAALRAAQVEMWRQRQWQSPYYWAAFTLQGEWR